MSLLLQILDAVRLGLEAILASLLDQAQVALSWLTWVALASAAGGAMRFLVSGLVARGVGETFPWGTLAVNATGAFAIGVMAGAADAEAFAASSYIWPAAVTGFLGSYTTVSSFSLQTLALAREGGWLRAAGNIVLSLVLCLSAAALGLTAALEVTGRGGA